MLAGRVYCTFAAGFVCSLCPDYCLKFFATVCSMFRSIGYLQLGLHIWEIQDLYLGRETGCLDWRDLCVCPQSLQGKWPNFCLPPAKSFPFHFYLLPYSSRSRHSVVTGYGLDDLGVDVRVPVWSRIFSTRRSDQLWSPPNLLSNGYWGPFPGNKAAVARSCPLTSS
jgi:hypothetical protein